MSDWKEVVAYELGYRHTDKTKLVALTLENDDVVSIILDTMEELAYMAETLRWEKSMYYNVVTADLSTGTQPVGQEQTSS